MVVSVAVQEMLAVGVAFAVAQEALAAVTAAEMGYRILVVICVHVR